jgi:hypothetical protein
VEQNPTEKDEDFPKGIFKPVTDCLNFDAIDDGRLSIYDC